MNCNFYQRRLFLTFYFRWHSFKPVNSHSQGPSKDPKISVDSCGLLTSGSSLLPAPVSLIHPTSMWIQNCLWKTPIKGFVIQVEYSVLILKGVLVGKGSHILKSRRCPTTLCISFSLCPILWTNKWFHTWSHLLKNSSNGTKLLKILQSTPST